MNNWKRKTIVRKWERRGKPVPPPHVVKQSIIRSYQQKYEVDLLIETGTFRGEMLMALKDDFRELYSIELSPQLYQQCVAKLAPYKHIKLYQGDSGSLLTEIINTIKQPAIFWLDSHYSGGITGMGDSETPVLKELEIIFNKPEKHIILIDDARNFGDPDHPEYPSLNDLTSFMAKFNIKYHMEVSNDIIRIILL